MPQNITVWIGFLVVLLLVIGAALVLLSGRPETQDQASIETALPDIVADWSAAESAASYDPETIYDYINGHAEVYLAYGMKRSLARRYAGPEGEADIVLDLFELGSPADAYGVFTHDLDGVPVGVGNDSRFRYGWLSFWRGPWFVSVSSEMESESANQAVLELGRAVAELLTAEGEPPPVVGALPTEGLEAQSVRFFRHPSILSTHYWLGDENVFGLGPDTAAALGMYDLEGTSGRLLIVDYAGERQAVTALESFNQGVLGGADGEGVQQVDDRGWFGAKRSDSRVAAVLGADSEELARWLLNEATEVADE